MKAYVYLITLTKGNNIENLYGTYTGTKESFEDEFLMFNSVSKLLKQGFALYLSECVLIDPKIAPMNQEDNPNKIEIKPATPENGGMPIP